MFTLGIRFRAYFFFAFIAMQKILLVLILFTCILNKTQAQENLIRNPSFEDMNWCWSHDTLHRHLDFCDLYPFYLKPKNKRVIQNLNEFSENSYSLPTNSYVSFYVYAPVECKRIGFSMNYVGVPSCLGDFIPAKDKLAMAEFRLFSVRENPTAPNSLLQGTFTKPLQKGCRYRFSSFLKIPDYRARDAYRDPYMVTTSSFGVAFTNDSVYYPSIEEFILKVKPDIENDSTNFFDKVGSFMEFTGIYTAHGGERYFTLGNFRSKDKTKIKPFFNDPQYASGYVSDYYIDDLSLTAIPPDHLKLNLGKDTLFCGKDQPLKLAAQQGFDSYKWNTGDTGRTISVSKAGTYIVQADFGCGVLSDTIVVKAYSYKKNQLQIGEQLQKCPEEQISLKAANGYNNYTWSNGQTGAELSTSQEGMYIIQATSPESCIVKDSVEIFNILPPKPVYLGKDTIICLGKNILLDAGSQNAMNFTWNTGNQNQTIEAKGAGNYSVSVSNKCFQTSDTIVVSTKDCSPIFIPNVFTPNGDGNNDTFKIRTEDNRTVNLDVYNRWGDKIYFHSNYSDHWAAESIPDGMYFYQITDSEYAKTEKGWVQVIR